MKMNHFVYFVGIICLCTTTFEVQGTWNPSVDECPEWEMLCRPTIIPSPNFDVTTDTNQVYSAIKYKNKERLIDIIARRTVSERQLIISEYKSTWGSVLLDDIQNLSWDKNAERLIHSLLNTFDVFYAKELKKAKEVAEFRGFAMVDILGALTNKGNLALKGIYRRVAGEDFSSDIIFYFNDGTLHSFYNSLHNGKRTEGTQVTDDRVDDDVNRLKEAADDYPVFKRLVMNNNNVHLRAVYEQFLKTEGQTFGDKLTKLVSRLNYSLDKLAQTTHAMYQITNDRSTYFADRLHWSLHKHLGIDHDTIRRIIAGRAEIDLGNIQSAYSTKYSITLIDDIKRKLPGIFGKRNSYIRILINLLGDSSAQEASSSEH